MTEINQSLWQNLKAGDVISLWEIFMPDKWIKGENLFDHMRSINVAPMMQAAKGKLGEDVPKDVDFLNHLLIFTEYFGLSVSASTIKAQIAVKKEFSYQEFLLLSTVFRSELVGKSFLMINASRKKYWEGDEKVANKPIFDRFPRATEDYDEACKCFAVGRNTATVFHLMRATEVVVQSLAANLGIEDVSREWGKLLSSIDSKIKDMPKDEKRKNWNEARANLYHVKECWRNETMHPKQTYTDNEAKAILDATTTFMLKLASFID